MEYQAQWSRWPTSISRREQWPTKKRKQKYTVKLVQNLTVLIAKNMRFLELRDSYSWIMVGDSVSKPMKGTGKDMYPWYSAFSWNGTSEALGYGTCSPRDLTVLPTHPHVHPQLEWAISAFAFPAIAGTHLPTPEGWKAELAWVAGYVVRQFTCPNNNVQLYPKVRYVQMKWYVHVFTTLAIIGKCLL